MIIDVHAHFVPTILVERFDAEKKKFPGVSLTRDGGVKIAFNGGEPTRPMSPKLSDLGERRAWMDRNGIDHQLVGGWLDVFGYELPAEQGLAWSRYINACLRESLEGEKRFTPLATVPLQHGAMAAQVLEEAMQQGFGGVMIGTLPKGDAGNLDSPDLDAFWQTASRLKAAIYLHPMFVCGEPRLGDYDMVNAIGRLVDTSIAVTRLLYSGHLLKYPGMKLVVSHGGAALPLVLGRLQRNYVNSQGKYADPAQGFNTLYFDSVVLDADALRFLALKASPGRIMLGSDAPFPIGDPEPCRVVEAAFEGDARTRVLERNARDVFRIRRDGAGRS
ncbi:MAG: amidohydrolase family protein [Rhodospirillaceae bacterium]